MTNASDLRDILACNAEGTAAWRERLVSAYPEDYRNVVAASDLYKLGEELRKLPDDDLHLRTLNALLTQADDIGSFIDTESRSLREVGFRRHYGGEARTYLWDLIADGDLLHLGIEPSRDAIRSASARRRGRPPIIDWAEFHLEVMWRIVKHGLPAKHDAFILEMQVWVRTRFSREVSRTSVFNRTKGYYAEFAPKGRKSGRRTSDSTEHF